MATTATARSERAFDVVLWGATGFTGSLTAAFLASRAEAEGLSWAMAGRSQEKLEAVRASLDPAAAEVPLLVADSTDRPSLDRLAESTRVVLTTVGPYALYGSDLVAACVAAGTDYCDLAGEVQWLRAMIDAHQPAAEQSGARIVHCCGFDSIPSDLGVHFLQREAQQRFGAFCDRVGLRVRAARGGMSGGTVASMLNLVEESRRDPAIAKVVKSPYALNPPDSRKGPRQRNISGPTWDPDLESWLFPFVMAAINTRVVHRSNAVAGFPYGADFRYDEAMMAGGGLGGRLKATSASLGLGGFMLASAFGPTRGLLKKTVLPAPGEGPDAAAREAGFFNIVLVGHTPGGDRLKVRVTGDRDPGYGSTSKMIGESAICLARDLGEDDPGGGFWTPATAMGDQLIGRLAVHSGLTFTVLDD